MASGFQNLFDRGDLVDVTLACDGKLIQAHKIVLAICSPYFQEMFITNPCRHPISKWNKKKPFCIKSFKGGKCCSVSISKVMREKISGIN